jgi:thymidylate synthase ThyX
MKVTLINYFGMGLEKPYELAARHLVYIKNTRLQQGPSTREEIAAWPWERVMDELAAIANTIRSSWEFLDYTFEISEVTRAFTHQLVRTRQGSYAQQTMRTIDMTGFNVTCPESIKQDTITKSYWAEYIKYVQGTYATLLADGADHAHY